MPVVVAVVPAVPGQGDGQHCGCVDKLQIHL
jgi:hypothetical protein